MRGGAGSTKASGAARCKGDEGEGHVGGFARRLGLGDSGGRLHKKEGNIWAFARLGLRFVLGHGFAELLFGFSLCWFAFLLGLRR